MSDHDPVERSRRAAAQAVDVAPLGFEWSGIIRPAVDIDDDAAPPARLLGALGRQP